MKQHKHDSHIQLFISNNNVINCNIVTYTIDYKVTSILLYKSMIITIQYEYTFYICLYKKIC